MEDHGTTAGHGRPKAARNDPTRKIMFRIIGATVVYGWALYGLGRWLSEQYNNADEE